VKIPYTHNANRCDKRSNGNIFTYTQGSEKIFASRVGFSWSGILIALPKISREVAMATKFWI